jgi:hypothetical protein
MWSLFTAALTRASSTTRVSIVNVSANFMATALLGWVIFGERLPPLWWGGAALLAAGNVVIGRREEKEAGGGRKEEEGGETVGLEREGGKRRGDGDGAGAGAGADTEEQAPLMRDGGEEEGADMIDLDVDVASAESTREAVKKGEDADAPLI